MNHKTLSLRLLAGFLWLLFMVAVAPAKEVKVFLFNGKTVQGELLEENEEHIIVLNELGQIKMRRTAIESVLYLDAKAVSSMTAPDSAGVDPLDDLVVVHLTNGETVTGRLVSKSLDSIVMRSEWGPLTVAKNQVKLIEYINTEFAERGETVVARLTNGQTLQGYIFHEDKNTVTLITDIGRLTLEKKLLRSLEYHATARPVKTVTAKRDAAAPMTAMAVKSLPPSDLTKRQDSFFAGYTPQLGESYSSGVVLGYSNRYLLRRFQSFSLNANAQLSTAIFSLNKAYYEANELPGSMTAKGAAMVSSLLIGMPLHFFPSENPPYEFILRPAIETHLVYKSLQRSYPSFPSLNTDDRATDFRFGFCTEVGAEWKLNQQWRLGFSFAMHFITKEDDYNSFNLILGTRLY